MKNFFSLIPLNNKYPALHALRFFAICAVLQHHVSNSLHEADFPVPDLLLRMSLGSWFGMDFFFIMSGFLIGIILIHSMKKEKFKFIDFYARRFLRLIPLYIVCLLLIYMINNLPHFIGTGFQSWGPHPINWREWVYLTNYPPSMSYTMPWSWSLSMEEHFYILVPFLMLVLFRTQSFSRQMVILVIGWLSCLLIKQILLFNAGDSVDFGWFFTNIYTPTHTRFDNLLTGILTAMLVSQRSETIQKLFQSTTVSTAVPLLAAAVLLSVAFVFPLGYFLATGQTKGFNYYWLGTFMVGTLPSILYVGVILWAIYSSSQLKRFLAHRFFLIPATLGYGCYLVHVTVIKELIQPYVLPTIIQATDSGYLVWMLSTIASIVASFSIAYVLHLSVEKPSLYLRDKLFPST